MIAIVTLLPKRFIWRFIWLIFHTFSNLMVDKTTIMCIVFQKILPIAVLSTLYQLVSTLATYLCVNLISDCCIVGVQYGGKCAGLGWGGARVTWHCCCRPARHCQHSTLAPDMQAMSDNFVQLVLLQLLHFKKHNWYSESMLLSQQSQWRSNFQVETTFWTFSVVS